MLTRIPHQPISFYEVENCPMPNNTVFQLIKPDDKIQFQFKLDEPCSENPINLIENGGFQDCEIEPWDLNGCWECVEVPGRSGVCWDSSAEGCDEPASLSQIITTTAGAHIYRVRFQVYNYEAGSLAFNIGFFEYLNVSADGIYEVYMTQNGGSLNFNFMPSTDFKGCIDNVEMIQMDGIGYLVQGFSLAGDILFSLDSWDTPEYFNFTNNFVTFTCNQGFAAPGVCFYVCIKDYCDCPVSQINVDLEDPYTPWVLLPGTGSFNYEPTEGWIKFTGKDEGDADSIKSPDFLCVGLPYEVQFTIGNFPTNAGIKMRNGTNSTGFKFAAGTYTLTFVAETEYLIFDGQSVGADGEAWVDAIQINPLQPQTSDSFDYCSQPFQSIDDGEYCTQLLEGCNDSDAFGFCFVGSGFQPSVRVQSKLQPAQPNTTGIFEINSLGTKSPKYSEVRVVKNLKIIETAVYIWEFLFKWAYLDNTTIEGEAYVMEEDSFQDVTWNKFNTKGTGSIPMGEKTQGMFKTNCGNGGNC